MWYFSEEERQLKDVCREFALREIAPYAEMHDTNETFNIDTFKKMGELGLLGITADPKFGGAGLGATAATIVMEEFGKACPGLTLSYLAHSMLCVNNISTNCSEKLKEKYLPKLITGEHIGAMGMSEPGYGSDAVGMQCRAKKDGDVYSITGNKMWITNAGFANLFTVFAKIDDDKKKVKLAVSIDPELPQYFKDKSINK